MMIEFVSVGFPGEAPRLIQVIVLDGNGTKQDCISVSWRAELRI